jgi:hypothetical protein
MKNVVFAANGSSSLVTNVKGDSTVPQGDVSARSPNILLILNKDMNFFGTAAEERSI